MRGERLEPKIKFCTVSNSSFLLDRTGIYLGNFWKVAQSLQKCLSPWLADKESLRLWNS